MLAVPPDRRQWLRAHPLEIAIVFLTPPFLPSSLQALRVFRLLQFCASSRQSATPAACSPWAGSSMALSSLSSPFSAAERPSPRPRDQTSLPGTASGWAVTTMTTVGYGDITPDTNAGRFIAILVMVVGIGFLTLLIGSVSEKFLEAGLQGKVAEVELEVGEDVAVARQEILAEIRAIGDRLKGLELRVERVV